MLLFFLIISTRFNDRTDARKMRIHRHITTGFVWTQLALVASMYGCFVHKHVPLTDSGIAHDQEVAIHRVFAHWPLF
jgi:hypothetical protein